MTLSMQVDDSICQAHGLCVRAAAGVFSLPDDGEHAVVIADPVPEELVAAARRALVGCPEQAIREVTAADQV